MIALDGGQGHLAAGVRPAARTPPDGWQGHLVAAAAAATAIDVGRLA